MDLVCYAHIEVFKGLVVHFVNISYYYTYAKSGAASIILCDTIIVMMQ